MTRVAAAISLLALVVALWTLGSVLMARPPATPPPPTVVLTREWGQGVVRALRDIDGRLTTVEREVLLRINREGP